MLSPSTRKVDLGVKRNKYLDIGIPEVWFLDPVERTVRIARSDVPMDTVLSPPDVLRWLELPMDLTTVFSDD